MTPFEIYLLLTLDSVLGFLISATIFFGIAVIGSSCVFMVADDGYYDKKIKAKAKKVAVFAVPLMTFFWLAAVLTPSTKTAIAMYVIPPVMNSEAAKKVPDILNKSLELIGKKLDESLGKKK